MFTDAIFNVVLAIMLISLVSLGIIIVKLAIKFHEQCEEINNDKGRVTKENK